MTPTGLAARLAARRPPPPPKPELPNNGPELASIDLRSYSPDYFPPEPKLPEWRKRLVGRDETGRVMA
jgi:hypothetical protein